MLLILIIFSFVSATILKGVNSFSMFQTLLPITIVLITLISQYSLTIKVILPKATLINCSIEKLKNSLAMLHSQFKLTFVKPLLFDDFLSLSLGQILMEFSIITFNLTSIASINKEPHFLKIDPS